MASSNSAQHQNTQPKSQAPATSQDVMLAHVGSWTEHNGPVMRDGTAQPPQSSQAQQPATTTAGADQGYQMARWLQESGKEGPWAPHGKGTQDR
ncbi:hypothetical protein PG994_013471 [Apiospora phragmitis]|uniref:Uncharacterized protein n=1 Tax=Apiospora phragmitis TaxID=2905665 RepID=A0ABR1T8Q3_9PEZI